jgi:hypothetical protein
MRVDVNRREAAPRVLVLRDLPWEQLKWPQSYQAIKVLSFSPTVTPTVELLFAEAMIETGEKEDLGPAEDVVMTSIGPYTRRAGHTVSCQSFHEAFGQISDGCSLPDNALELEPRNTEDWR